MELIAIAWVAYMIFIGTRTAEQRQNHLAVIWLSMAVMVIASVVYNLLR